MIVPKELSPRALEELRKINDTYGRQKPFLKKAKIQRGTFKRLITVGTAWADVIDRVERALELPPVDLTAELIMEVVAKAYNITPAQLKSPTHKSNEARQLAAWIMRKETSLSTKEIAEALSYAGHSSVLKAEQAIFDEIDSNRVFRKKVYELLSEITEAA